MATTTVELLNNFLTGAQMKLLEVQISPIER